MGPISTSSPARSTATRSAISATTPKSCVMNSTPVPCPRWSSRINARICACVVTSSAVVGSSAIRSAGSSTSAIAIMIRCRCPPESWCGNDASMRSGSGELHGAHDVQNLLAAGARMQRGVGREHFIDLVAATHDRVQRGHRLLEDHRHPRAPQRAQSGLVDGEQVLAGEADLAAGRGKPLRQESHDRVRDDALARPRFADQAHDFAAVHGQADVQGGAFAIGAGRQRDGQAANVEDRRTQTALTLAALTAVCSSAGRACRASRRPACSPPAR